MGNRKNATSQVSTWLATIILFALSLSACNSTIPTAIQPAQPSADVQNATAATPATPSPTETAAPTSTPQPRAVLLTPVGSDPQRTAALQELLADLAAQAGLEFQTVATLSPADLTSELRLVAALPPDPGLAALAAAAPGTQFLAIDMPGLPVSANLRLVDTQAARPDQQGFLAGYLASLVTLDWRVGVISTGDNPSGKANRQGFLNGAVFFCGLCDPAYPPFVRYPIYADLASSAEAADQEAAADSLIAQGVTTVYIAPGAGDASMLEYLAGKGVNLIGGVTPPPGIQDNWIATIQGDWLESVRHAWNAALNQQPVSDLSLPLAITDRNEALFSVGRQRLAEQVRDELASGLIDTGIDPTTGESK